MKVVADVEVVSRDVALRGISYKSRSSRSVLTIGNKTKPLSIHIKQDQCKEKGDLLLLVCTRSNPSGRQYKANPVELKKFLCAIRLCHQDRDTDKLELSLLRPAKTQELEKPQTSMAILSSQEYPVKRPFPSSLEKLIINDCGLKKLEDRIIRLECLKVLDLRNNCLKSLPDAFEAFQNLAELILANNYLTQVPKSLGCDKLAKSLKLLDLTCNGFTVFPMLICNLTSLSTLKIAQNRMTKFPSGISKLANLKQLLASDNQLAVLPHGFTKLSLSHIDLSDNPLSIEVLPLVKKYNMPVPNLSELALREVWKSNLTKLLPWQSLNRLQERKTCQWCHGSCFLARIDVTTSMDLHLIAHTVTAVDQTNRMVVPYLISLCSERCYHRWSIRNYRQMNV
ncbi:Leucine-rich repeat protein 1 [Trichoplax sp. H2]|nr:Leucine-rich repeat protein 1 [Trichoplax sp. H2]|eukprot:RDD39341.1 Leucine-rich repeat protein 1 [Trichoplax sp. H2]